MSYVRHVLQPGEKLLVSGRLHWIGYCHALAWLIPAILLLLLRPQAPSMRLVFEIGAVIAAIASFAYALRTALLRWGTEIGVTDRRVIYKHGLISRYTAEMNMDKIETVSVDQSLLGRIFDYGEISIKGSGASIETLKQIAEPLSLRAAITAR